MSDQVSSPAHRSDRDIAAATARLIRAVGTRLANSDPEDAHLLQLLDDALTEAWARAIEGWRNAGMTDADIGRALGVTKQAVSKRWPRPPTTDSATTQGCREDAG